MGATDVLPGGIGWGEPRRPARPEELKKTVDAARLDGVCLMFAAAALAALGGMGMVVQRQNLPLPDLTDVGFAFAEDCGENCL